MIENSDPLSVDALARRLGEIVAFGPRFAGTAGERHARDYLLHEFASLGLANVALEWFDYLGYEPLEACCSVIEGAELVCAPLQSAANAAATGRAVFIGDGTASDIDAARERLGSLSGIVVVTQPLNLFETAASLRDSGIAALVNVGATASGLVASYTASLYPPPLRPPWDGRLMPFPGVTIEAAAARRLTALMSSGGLSLSVEHSARYHDARGANVVAEVPGTERPEEIVIVGAHYDTQLDCPGAWDNGSGIASLLQIAVLVAAQPGARTVRFVGFSAEEPGLWGSYTHSLGLGDELDRVVGMINLDTVGAPLPGPRVLVASPGMRKIAAGAARSVGWEPDFFEDPDDERYFDHTPFADAGIPVACFLQNRLAHPYYHSSGDTLELVNFGQMSAAARAAAATVRSLAIAAARPERPEPWPRRRHQAAQLASEYAR